MRQKIKERQVPEFLEGLINSLDFNFREPLRLESFWITLSKKPKVSLRLPVKEAIRKREILYLLLN